MKKTGFFPFSKIVKTENFPFTKKTENGIKKGNFIFPLLNSRWRGVVKNGKCKMTEFEMKQKMNRLSSLLKTLKFKEAEFEDQNQALMEDIENLKAELKEVILDRQESVKTDYLHISYRSGSVKWDTKWLDGFAIEHPEYRLGRYRKVGEPTVAFYLPKDQK
jgi:hypothetical protein